MNDTKDSFSPEENARESKRLYKMLDDGVRDQLMKYPGVRHVSVGLKITGNDTLLERCFHVYTDKKLSRGEMKPEDIVPPEINGIRTDVHEIGTAVLAVCHDLSRYERIKGGISISNGTILVIGGVIGGAHVGTLGAIGRITGPCKCNTFALTNWHVLYIGKSFLTPNVGAGSRIFHPASPGGTTPDITTYDIGKIVDGVFTTSVDCGLVEINRSCSNCCGVPYDNVIRGLETISPLAFNGITGPGTASTGDVLYYVGVRSGPTTVRVITDSAPKFIEVPNEVIGDERITTSTTGTTVRNFVGQLKLQLEGTHACNSSIPMPSTYTGPAISRAIDHGDSGSLLVNARNQAVGLVFASDEAIPASAPFTLFGYANHYSQVISALSAAGHTFEINYTEAPTGGSRGESIAGFTVPDNEVLLSWKKRVEAHPRSRAIADAVARHREEVLLLINHCRPVTVAWHRGKGPAYAATIFNNVNEGKFEYPPSINGVTADQLLLRMYHALVENGSSGLREDLYSLKDDIIENIKGRSSFEEALAALTAEGVIMNS